MPKSVPLSLALPAAGPTALPSGKTSSGSRATAFTATVAAAVLGAAVTGFATLDHHVALPGLPSGAHSTAFPPVPHSAVLPTPVPGPLPTELPAAATAAGPAGATVVPSATLTPVANALAAPAAHSIPAMTAGAFAAGRPAHVAPALLLAFPAPAPVAPPPTAGTVALAAARTAMGTRYVWGGSKPGGFDCSGLMLWAFKKAGISLPRSSRAQSAVGKPVSRGELQPGDLVFFYSPVSHVGIYVGDGNVLHAPQSGDVVKISPLGRMPFHNARRV